ncbi:hypothetical protein HK103_004940 [Boothiomyces macroporosus]|uniref:Bromo domain-containing protein n=1 Tax=Boothiomyces macroporosus TaxID=261099 RepID=A0AAD5Y347_9FUNG|nr:hypothetical protein HK103_004940 [Boothiomyces macroporosus]
MEYSVQKYLHKIVEMAKEFNPVAPKLKFKMPSIKVNATPSIVEESMSIDMPLILSPVDEVVNTPPPAPKPKKEKIKKEAVKIVEPPKQLNPVFDRARKVLKRLFAQKISFWFKEPVDPVALNLPTYTTIVKNPMDLGTVKKKLDNDEYGTEEEFAADVRLTFENSILFNPPGSQVAIDANILLLKFNREIAMTDFDGVKGFPENALHIIDKMLESEHSAIFRFPVDANLYPEYYQIITDPIDIQTITIKLNEGKYADLNEFHASVQLIFKNCFTFNKKGTFGHAAGTELQNLYQRLIKPYAKNITNFQPVKTKVTAKPKSTPVKASTPVKQPVATPHQIEHVVATPHQIEHVVATPQQNERVVATPQQNERAVATPTPVIPVETPKVAFKPIKLKMKVRPPAAPTPTTTTEIIESTGTVFKPEESTTKNDAMEVDISEDVKQEKVEIVGSENPTETSQPVQTTEAPPPVTEPPKKLKLKFKLSSK